MEPTKSDVVLSDGREVTIDLNAISISEFRSMLKAEQSNEDEYRTLEKLTGLQGISELGLQDYRKLISAFFAKVKEPVNPT